jgi:ribonuclease R
LIKVEVKFNLDEAGEPQGVYFKVSKMPIIWLKNSCFWLIKKWQNSLVNKRKLSFIEFMMNKWR